MLPCNNFPSLSQYQIMHLLLLLSGSAPVMMRHLGLPPENVEVVKVDEKIVAMPRQMLALVRAKNYESVVWGCKALSYQRFQVMMKFAVLCSAARSGMITDEEGAMNRFGMMSFFFRDVPQFLGECCAAAFVVPIAYVCLPILLARVKRSSAASLQQSKSTR
jgi:hypothetical protein